MTGEPKTWHYGLMARWWAEFNVARDKELAYYSAAIERFGQPALDVGCGTGRILLPLARAGVEVDGCDVSADMIAFCREQAAREGLNPRLYTQPLHALSVDRTYRTIYICDSFGIGGRRDHDAEGLRRCHDALEAGGALVFNHYLPYMNAEQWVYWLPDRSSALPHDWPDQGDRRRTQEGDELELRSRLADLDPLNQRLTLEMRMTLWRDGRQISQDEHALVENLYFCQEILLLLSGAGFRQVEVFDG